MFTKLEITLSQEKTQIFQTTEFAIGISDLKFDVENPHVKSNDLTYFIFLKDCVKCDNKREKYDFSLSFIFCFFQFI